MNQPSNEHIPVLLEATLRLLAPAEGETYLDLTAGYGGHAEQVIERTQAPQKATLVDRDEQAIRALAPLEKRGVKIVFNDFLAAAQQLAASGEKFDMILLDLGISSPHVDNAERGFSLQKDGPLDMRMDQSSGQTAAELIDSATEEELRDIIRKYGEEPRAARVARALVEARPFTSTLELAETVRIALPGPRKRVHPATKTFQAIRIAVNSELQQLEQVLPITLELLNPGGRLAVISFHSLEDRLVKKFIREESTSGFESRVEALLKKPIDGATDDVLNPRARSAKLRVALKKPG